MKVTYYFLAVASLIVSIAAEGATAPPVAPSLCLDDKGCGAGPGLDLEKLDARFIGPGGNDGNDGRTHVTRWSTTVPARGLPTGTSVFLQAGYDQGPREWQINWGGRDSEPAVIGCYYLDPDNKNQVTSCHLGSKGGSLAKPIIRGTYVSSCRQSTPSTCPVDVSGAVPANKWNGLVDIRASHVVIQDIEVRDSSGAGIRHNSNYSTSNVTIQRVRVIQTYGTGIWFAKAMSDSQPVLSDSHVELAALQRVDGRESNWPPAVLVDSDGLVVNARIEGNFVRDSGGEGIGALRLSGIIIKGNTVANNRRPLVYLDNTSDAVVEENMLLGNGYMNGKDESFGVALGVAVEPYRRVYDSVRNIFRNNLVANTSGGISIAVYTSSRFNPGDINPAEAGYKVGLRAHGNTILQGKSDFLKGNNLTVNNNVDYIEISDNIFVGSLSCTWPTLSESVSKMTNNIFETRPSNSNCLGANSVIKDPKIPLDYVSVHADNIPSRQDFKSSTAP